VTSSTPRGASSKAWVLFGMRASQRIARMRLAVFACSGAGSADEPSITSFEASSPSACPRTVSLQ
jgi:hypothetical protein